jgi:hypothetical protein
MTIDQLKEKLPPLRNIIPADPFWIPSPEISPAWFWDMLVFPPHRTATALYDEDHAYFGVCSICKTASLLHIGKHSGYLVCHEHRIYWSAAIQPLGDWTGGGKTNEEIRTYWEESKEFLNKCRDVDDIEAEVLMEHMHEIYDYNE